MLRAWEDGTELRPIRLRDVRIQAREKREKTAGGSLFPTLPFPEAFRAGKAQAGKYLMA